MQGAQQTHGLLRAPSPARERVVWTAVHASCLLCFVGWHW